MADGKTSPGKLPLVLRNQPENVPELQMANLLDILESMEHGVSIVNRSHRIEYVNSVLRRAFGPVEDRKCFEYFHDRKDPCPWCKNSRVFAGETLHWEWKSPQTGRTYSRLEGPIRNPDGSISKLKVFQDVTHRKHEEERLETLRADLAHTGRLKTMGEMASGIAHELNQPLAAIVMKAELACTALRNGTAVDQERLLESLQFIADMGIRAGEIIRRMRQFVQKKDPERAPIDLGQAVDELLPLVQNELGHAGVVLTIDLEPSLPAALADGVQVQQVLLNLVRNAMDAMQATSPLARRICIRATARAEFVEIAVSDTGAGITGDQVPKLFESFYSTKPDGMGMGLAISRSIVHAHGGRIWANRNDDGGSTFTFTLPIAREQPSPNGSGATA